MAVIYFTSNASTGAGSLAESVGNAQPGDVVRPDETVFERGSTIEIALASTLTIDKNLTLDASPFRVRLDGGGAFGCVAVATSVNAGFAAFDFIGGVAPQNGGGLRVESDANVSLSRCLVCGCDAAQYGGGIYVGDAAILTANDSAIFGNRAQFGGGVYVGDDAAATLSGATVCGNVDANAGLDIDGETSTSALAAVNSILGNAFDDPNVSGSVVGVASSTIGFVASPPDDLTVDTWTPELWRSWDLRLLDDASPNPSPYRDSGDVDAASKYDFDGNFRGRESEGVATRSPGAYETLQADLFWVGKPFPQEMIDAAPQNIRVANYRQTTGSNLYEADMTWEIPDGVSYASIFGQYSSNEGASWTNLGYVAKDATSRKATQLTPGKEYRVRLRGVFADGSYTAWSVITYASPLELDGSDGEQSWELRLPTALSVVNPSFQTSDGWATSRFATAFSDKAPQVGQKLFVGSDVVFVDAPAQGSSLNIGGYAVVSTGTGGTESIVSTFGFGATFAISIPVILQRVGGFVKFNWTSGNVTVNTNLTTSELSIPSGESMTVNGVFVSIETLRVNNSSTVAFSSVDAILAATETATVGAATFTGTGYFATPPGTDTSSASFAENVRNCDYGANVSSFSASPSTATAALLSWVKQNLTPSVLIEEANGDAWNVVNNRATGDSLFVDISVPKTFRLFDGEKFFTASARPYGTAYELAEEQTIGYLKTLISTGYLN